MLYLSSFDRLLPACCKISEVPHCDAINVRKISSIFVRHNIVTFRFVSCFGGPLIGSDPDWLSDYVGWDNIRLSVKFSDVADIAINLVLIGLHIKYQL